MLTKQPFARRIVIAFTLMTLVVSGVFSLGIVAVVYFVESQLVTEELSRELDIVLHEDLPSGRPPRLDAQTRFFSTALPDYPLPEGFATLPEGFTEVVRGDEAYYVYVRDLDGERYVLMEDQNEFEERENALFKTVLAGFLLSVLGAWLLGRLMAHKVMAPVSRLANQVRHRDQLHPLAPPLALQYVDDEVGHLAAAFDSTLGQLRQTLERERLFTADVAHELRTPLAGLRLHLELIEKAHHVDVKPLLQRLDQMTQSVSQLLQLARVGQSFASGDYQQVPLLAEVIEPMRGEFEAMLHTRHQRLQVVAPQDVTVRGDATLLRAMLRNLVENAHRYSPENTNVFIRVETAPHPLLVVEDEGPGIDETKSGELSKAFVRMDRRYGGIGLGLSIVTRIVQLHQAQFILDNRSPGPGCRARVRFL